MTPHRIETHEPTATKFRTFDFSARGPAKPNLVLIHPLEDSGHMGEIQNITFLCLFYLYFFSETRVEVRPVDGFLRAIAH